MKGFVKVYPTDAQRARLLKRIHEAEMFLIVRWKWEEVFNKSLVKVDRKILFFWNVPTNVLVPSTANELSPFGISYDIYKGFHKDSNFEGMIKINELDDVGLPIYLDDELVSVWKEAVK